jgi:uncharacterized membrane protein
MAAVTSITVSAQSPKGVTIAFAGDFNSAQLKTLKKVVDRACVECTAEDGSMSGVPTVVPAAWDATLRI